jgi:hypothetical protein
MKDGRKNSQTNKKGNRKEIRTRKKRERMA